MTILYEIHDITRFDRVQEFASYARLGLHELQGVRRGTWAVKVSGNWRGTFAFAGVDVTAVDYEDYH